MRWAVVLFICPAILAYTPCVPQEPARIRQFTVTDTSRLHALATLGRITDSSLLVEAGDMSFLEEPVTISENKKSFDELVRAILPGSENYEVRRRGALSIIFPVTPRKPRNRILTLQLGRFSFKGKSVSSLSPNLALQIREVTGCHPEGSAYAGPPMEIGVPDFDLPAATFEDVAEQAAKAAVPTMWIVMPDAGERGCIADPGRFWQVGIYNNDPNSPYAFREATGPIVLR